MAARCARRLCQAGGLVRPLANRVWASGTRWGQARSMGLYDEMMAMAGRTDTARSSRRPLPDHIVKPDYAMTGTPSAKLPRAQWMIEQHSDADIELARTAGRISREVLDEVGKAVAVGVTTDELDRICHEETIKRGAYPSPLNYHGFPRSVCTSLNEVVCHGIPENRTLQDGDILNIDVSCYVGGFHGDNSEMFCVGEVDDAGKLLIQVRVDWITQISKDICALCAKTISLSRSRTDGHSRLHLESPFAFLHVFILASLFPLPIVLRRILSSPLVPLTGPSSLIERRTVVQVTYDSWKAAIAICKPGVPYNAIGGVIEDYVSAHGFSTTRNYCGLRRIFLLFLCAAEFLPITAAAVATSDGGLAESCCMARAL